MVPHNTVKFAGENEALQVGVNTGSISFDHKKAKDDCLNDLRLTNPRDDKERIKETKGGLLEDSYKWILDLPDFQRWRDDDEMRLLWIKGDPGKGKTMLLIGIVEELERQLVEQKEEQSASPTVLSYFFCQGSDSNLNSFAAIIRGLIYLIAIQQPSLASDMREQYEHSGSKLFKDTNAFIALSKILVGILQDPQLKKAYIIIDALDECETDLYQLLKFVVENTSTSRVKWIVSSRNRPDIEQQLKLDDSQTKISLELKANAEHVSHAVNSYIDVRVSELASLHDDEATRHQVGHLLRQKAAGTFLWVALVVQELRNVPSWDILGILEEMPIGLEELYARMMKQILGLKRRNPELCRLMLSTVAITYLPLRITELSILAGLPDKISNKLQSIRELVNLCGSFLILQDDRVYIIHQSAKDYLMSDKTCKEVFLMKSTDIHREISLRSLHAMSNTLRRDIYKLRHPGFSMDNLYLMIPDPDPLASIKYACTHWVVHLYNAERRDDLIDDGPAHKFLADYLLYWVEASSLVGALPQIPWILIALNTLLQKMFIKSSQMLDMECLQEPMDLVNISENAKRVIDFLSHFPVVRRMLQPPDPKIPLQTTPYDSDIRWLAIAIARNGARFYMLAAEIEASKILGEMDDDHYEYLESNQLNVKLPANLRDSEPGLCEEAEIFGTWLPHGIGRSIKVFSENGKSHRHRARKIAKYYQEILDDSEDVTTYSISTLLAESQEPIASEPQTENC